MPYTFNGYFTSTKEKPVTYTAADGIRNHKPPYNTIWDRYPEQKMMTGEFIDRLTGLTTDRFYGNCTDFNEWFIGKVARGERFDLFITDTETLKRVRIDECYGRIGNPCGAYEKLLFECDSDGRWSLAS